MTYTLNCHCNCLFLKYLVKKANFRLKKLSLLSKKDCNSFAPAKYVQNKKKNRASPTKRCREWAGCIMNSTAEQLALSADAVCTNLNEPFGTKLSPFNAKWP